MDKVRTRIAPSPTGSPHIGTIYQALFDYAYAKKHNGSFVLRIEDTDRKRFVEGAENEMHKALKWFGLTPDEDTQQGGKYGPYRQSERLDVYKKYAHELIMKKHAYYCFCTPLRLDEMRKSQQKNKQAPKYDKKCLHLKEKDIESRIKTQERHVIRLDVQMGRTIKFHDLIVGDISFESSVLDDQVLIKSDGFPTYHLAVVVDDNLMKISHIFRGKEWISSTPKHILLYEYFGWKIPQFAHLPLILNAQGKGKLSKRHDHGAVSYYIQEGYLPEAVLNYLSNIVWNHPKDREIYDLDEFISLFDISHVTSQGARFDLPKLDWMNGEYIKKSQNSKLKVQIYEFYGKKYAESIIEKIIPLVKERMNKLSEFQNLAGFFFERPDSYEKVVNKEWLKKTIDVLKSTDWLHDSMVSKGRKLAQSLNVSFGKLAMDIRIAITGKKVGPPLFESMEILGKEESIERIKNSIARN